MSSLRVDQNGNIDPVFLEKELQSALEFDLKYKQTDGMKKRAIKTAGTYDEFKNMVACAHLKTVSREEVESLRAVKKGWTKKKERAPETLVLEKEMATSTGNHTSAAVIEPKKKRKPKTSMDFDRDWRRMKTVSDKLSYLAFVGLARSTKILKCDMSAELMEDIVLTLLQHQEESINAEESTKNEASEAEVESPTIVPAFAWLKSFSEFDRFSLNVRFLNQDTILRVSEWLSEKCQDEEDVAVVAARYNAA